MEPLALCSIKSQYCHDRFLLDKVLLYAPLGFIVSESTDRVDSTEINWFQSKSYVSWCEWAIALTTFINVLIKFCDKVYTHWMKLLATVDGHCPQKKQSGW